MTEEKKRPGSCGCAEGESCCKNPRWNWVVLAAVVLGVLLLLNVLRRNEGPREPPRGPASGVQPAAPETTLE
jgi:hypothetical protein